MLFETCLQLVCKSMSVNCGFFKLLKKSEIFVNIYVMVSIFCNVHIYFAELLRRILAAKFCCLFAASYCVRFIQIIRVFHSLVRAHVHSRTRWGWREILSLRVSPLCFTSYCLHVNIVTVRDNIVVRCYTLWAIMTKEILMLNALCACAILLYVLATFRPGCCLYIYVLISELYFCNRMKSSNVFSGSGRLYGNLASCCKNELHNIFKYQPFLVYNYTLLTVYRFLSCASFEVVVPSHLLLRKLRMTTLPLSVSCHPTLVVISRSKLQI